MQGTWHGQHESCWKRSPPFVPAPVCLCKYARSQTGVRDRPSLQGMSAHWCWTASRRR